MKKIMTLFTIILILVSSNAIGEEFQSAEVINAQRQDQISVLIPVGDGNTISVGIQLQQQYGIGNSTYNSFAGDRQSQNNTTNGSSLTAVGSGLSNGGDYSYMNEQASITVDTKLVTIDGTQDVNAVVGGMGAMTSSNGNAVATSGGVLENGDWSMSNKSNSNTNPISVNVDGYINY